MTKNTKKAVWASALSILMCLSLLIGTTFAWFTDTASTSVNKIQSGNLDVELYYALADNYDGDATVWTKVDETKKLFNPNGSALFEPGYTETVYLKAVNAGNLALDYKFSVDVVSEVGSVNKAGNPFKLSDYLVFGMNDYPAAPTKFGTREAVWAEIAGTRGNLGRFITSAAELKEGMLPGKAKYFMLSVYMPTDVGNEANHDVAYNAPEISFGVTILASQASVEHDSFGKDYDSDNNAIGKWDDPVYINTSDVVYPAKMEQTATAEQATNGLILTSDNKVNETPVLTMTINGSDVSENDKFAASAVKTETPSGITVSSSRQAVSYEVTLTKNGEPVTVGNAANQPVEVKLFVGTKLTNVKVYHNAREMNASEYSYNPATGFVTFSSTTFSPFTITYTPGFALVTNEAELRAAVLAGNDVRLANDIALGSELYLHNVSALVLDGNGHKLTAAEGFQIEQAELAGQYQLVKIETANAVTLQNITLEHRALEQNTGSYHTLDIANSPNVTLSNVTLIRDFTATKGGAPLVINNSNVTVKNSFNVLAGGNAWYGFNVDKGGSLTIAQNTNVRFVGNLFGRVENGTFVDNTGNWVKLDNGYVTPPPIMIGTKGYTTLEAAVAEAKAGDTIDVAAGTYQLTQSIVLPSGVKLKGAQAGSPAVEWANDNTAAKTVIVAPEKDDRVIKILQDVAGVTVRDVVIDGIMIDCANRSNKGIYVKKSTGSAMQGIVIRNTAVINCGNDAMDVCNTDGVLIENNYIKSFYDNGIQCANYKNTEGRMSIIRNNVIDGASGTINGALAVSGGAGPVLVTGNTISNIGTNTGKFTGMGGSSIVVESVYEGGVITIEYNTLNSVEQGIAVYKFSALTDADKVVIRNNTVNSASKFAIATSTLNYKKYTPQTVVEITENCCTNSTTPVLVERINIYEETTTNWKVSISGNTSDGQAVTDRNETN